MPVSDGLLVKKAQNGDWKAFEILVQRHQKRIYNLALKMLGSSEDAKDAVQETFIQVYRSLPAFRGEAKFSTWLYRVASNRCLDMTRKQGSGAGKCISLEGDGGVPRAVVDTRAGPEDVIAERDTRERVRCAVSGLPEHYRMVLILHHYQGMSYKDVSNVLGISPNTVATHIARAKKILRKKLLGGEADALQGGRGEIDKLPGGRVYSP